MVTPAWPLPLPLPAFGCRQLQPAASLQQLRCRQQGVAVARCHCHRPSSAASSFRHSWPGCSSQQRAASWAKAGQQLRFQGAGLSGQRAAGQLGYHASWLVRCCRRCCYAKAVGHSSCHASFHCQLGRLPAIGHGCLHFITIVMPLIIIIWLA